VTEGEAQLAAAPTADGGRREDTTKERRPVRGLLVILSAPSGAGKDVVIEGLLRELEDATLYVTATSREPRAGEVHGRHYYFYSPQKFREEIEQGNFLEWSVVHGEYKGVRGDAVADALRRHRIVLVKPDPQGMRKLKAVLPEALTVFIQPPSLESLRTRLVGRGTETPESLELRMKNAEIEMAAAPEYDHVVVNEDGRLEDTVREVAEIVRKEAEHPRTYWL
jgi:guanylate kinase